MSHLIGHKTGRLRIHAGTSIVVGVAVVLLAADSAHAADVDPCAAKQAYEQDYAAAQKEATELKDKAGKMIPMEEEDDEYERRPQGTVAEWKEMIRKLKAHPGYGNLSRDQIKQALEDQRALNRKMVLRRDLDQDIESLNQAIGNLKAEQRGSEDKAKQEQLRKQIEVKQAQLRAKQKERLSIERPEEIKRKLAELDAKIHAAGMISVLTRWIAYEEATQKWAAADDRVEKLKADYDAAVQAKNQVLANAQAKFNNEQARIQRIRASLQGTTKDEAYYQKLSQMTLHAQATYELLLLTLVDYDCFPDVRSYMDILKQRLQKLDATRDQIIAQAGAAKTAQPAIAKAATPKPARAKPATGSRTKRPHMAPDNPAGQWQFALTMRSGQVLRGNLAVSKYARQEIRSSLWFSNENKDHALHGTYDPATRKIFLHRPNETFSGVYTGFISADGTTISNGTYTGRGGLLGTWSATYLRR